MNRIDIVISVKPDRRNEVVELLTSQFQRMRARSGCLECRLAQDLEVPEALVYSEAWSTSALLRDRVREADFGRVLVAIDLGCEPPLVHLDAGQRRTGLAALAQLRSDTQQRDSSKKTHQ